MKKLIMIAMLMFGTLGLAGESKADWSESTGKGYGILVYVATMCEDFSHGGKMELEAEMYVSGITYNTLQYASGVTEGWTYASDMSCKKLMNLVDSNNLNRFFN